jgi:glycosyltransferase involved in cell wall biosynthesis
VIAGDGRDDDKQKLHKLVENSGILNQTKFVGYIEGKEKMKLLSEASVFLIASRWETFGRTAIEAMAVGVPVVSFDIPGLKWIPDVYVKKIHLNDTIAYQEAVIELLKSEEKNKVFGLHAREFAKTFSWSDSAEKYSEFLREVIEKKV